MYLIVFCLQSVFGYLKDMFNKEELKQMLILLFKLQAILFIIDSIIKHKNYKGN